MSTDFVLFDFATENLHLATIFLPLSRQMRLKDFVNFEPCVLFKCRACLGLIKIANNHWAIIIGLVVMLQVKNKLRLK